MHCWLTGVVALCCLHQSQTLELSPSQLAAPPMSGRQQRSSDMPLQRALCWLLCMGCRLETNSYFLPFMPRFMYQSTNSSNSTGPGGWEEQERCVRNTRNEVARWQRW